MGVFLLALLVIVLVLFGLRMMAYANPATLAKVIRRSFFVVPLLGALALTFMKAFAFAVPLYFIAFQQLARQASMGRAPGSFGGGTAGGWNRPSSGQASTVRSSLVEMTLDHDTGDMQGVIISGPRAGQALTDLAIEDVIALFQAADTESAALLEAYLDRRSPSWREDTHADLGGGERQSGPVNGPMTQEEAYEILGLAPGAGETEIRSAHRSLMKRFHPDRGGTTYLAAKINEAKETLLNTHHS